MGSVWQCCCGERWAFVEIPAGVYVGSRGWVSPVPSWASYYPDLDASSLAAVRSLSPFDEEEGRFTGSAA